MAPDDSAATRSLLASQREYYEARAEDYADESKPSDRVARGLMAPELERELVDEFRPPADILELACGTGIFTVHLARYGAVTAVDASRTMLSINRERVGAANVRYVEADIFAWKPDRRYEAVFFSFWLSHVPHSAFDAFWANVEDCLAPGGRVCFVDEDDRAVAHERALDDNDVARRTLRDGREFDIVKVFWRPDELEARLDELGWRIDVRRVGETFMYGAGGRSPGA
jgi:demethylmenaquinone methyltransferase/2-methoxy-6-polyprenyl-1,4-benzoquinol methylase